ncbi:uncharacterized protein LOC114284182 [Camellia sinensis]|uniref:uncharacterized protein LOC114284182 n=1 Tax=Camellia sinensis TaxID=4442 RepID=UPI0010360AA0|nr:uncharacterized protein LOC114284182 [Camellia sinensis]
MEHDRAPARQPDDIVGTKIHSTVASSQQDHGGEDTDSERSVKEADLLERHHRKLKDPVGDNVAKPRSFKDALTHPFSLTDGLEPLDLRATALDLGAATLEVSNLETTIPIIFLSKDEIDRIRDPWRSTLIVKLVGRNLGYNFFMSKLKSLWKPTSTFHGIDLGNHFYLIKFNEASDLNKVLSDGPWFVGSNFLSVRRWEPDFQPTKASLFTTIVWARLHSLPIEYYDHSILQKIRNTLGKLHKMDIHTVNGDRGRFARLCIQIDLAKPLIAKITVGSSLVRVAYEGLSSVCFHCGLIGHRVEEWQNTANKNTPVENQANTPPADGEPFGPWMLVQKRSKSSKKQDPASHSNVQPRKVWVKKTEIQILVPNGQP